MVRSTLRDGLYQVDRYGICAGFEVKDGKVTACAPILRKKLAWWMSQAKLTHPY